MRRYEALAENVEFKPIKNEDTHSVDEWLRVDEVAWRVARKLFSCCSSLSEAEVDMLPFGKKIVPENKSGKDADDDVSSVPDHELGSDVEVDDEVAFFDEPGVDKAPSDPTLDKFVDLQAMSALDKTVDDGEQVVVPGTNDGEEAALPIANEDGQPKSDFSKAAVADGSPFQQHLRKQLEALEEVTEKNKNSFYTWLAGLHPFLCDCRREAGDMKPVPLPPFSISR